MNNLLLKLKEIKKNIGKYNEDNAQSQYLLNQPYIIRKVRLDASTLCQLKCSCCPNGRGILEKTVIGKGFLSFENFKKFVDFNPYIKQIELSNWGEIFLNPELGKIIKYAHEKNVILTANGGVNLNYLSDYIAEMLIKYHFNHLTVSLDGTSQKSYKIYRINGDFNKVLENIKKINYFKKKYNSEYPELTWKFVVFGHNEHEIPKARKMAEDLGMDFRISFNWDRNYSPIKNKDSVKKESGMNSYSKDSFKEKNERDFHFYCCQFWNSPQINWNGELLGCCVNTKIFFGNVFKEGLKECLNSEKYIYAKKMLLGIAKPREDIPCLYCHSFKDIMNNPIRKEEIFI